ncbi:MAG: hypothetical protein RL226_285, partial [Bacteroidota bacterium]
EVIEGPELQDIFGEFDVIETLRADRDTVDFSIGQTVNFEAELTIRTDWTIHITGLTSGARKQITGRERLIDGQSANWNGSITFAPLFESELCATMMTFKDHPDTLYGDTIFVESIRPEQSVDVLISDFETPGGWGSFAEAAATNQLTTTGYFVQDPNSTTPLFIQVTAPEGNGHWRMTYQNISSVFICGANMAAANSSQSPAGTYFNVGTSNPDHVYINMLVHGFGDGRTRLSIGLQEDDDLDGSYDRFTEGTYNHELLIDWVGWKVVSIPLNAFNLSTVAGFGNIDGTGTQNIDRIIQLEYLLLAAEGTTGFVGYGLDYCNFTRYTPWQP